MDKFSFYAQKVAQKNTQKRYEQLSCCVPQTTASKLDFTSTDYLQLSFHDHIKKGTIRSVLQYGAGSSSTRLISEHLSAQKSLEERLASLFEKDAAHLFPSNQKLHSSLLPALAPKGTIIYADRGNSHALKQAIELTKAEVKWYSHKSTHDLLNKIQDTPGRSEKQKLIVTESLFSVTGEEAALFDLCNIAKNTGSILYVDDSASVGMYGQNGLGLSSGMRPVDITVGTFGKAGGSFGSFAVFPEVLKEFLMTCCPSIAQSPPLAPALIGALSSALDVIPDMDEERAHIFSLSKILRAELGKRGVPITQANTHIISLPLRSNELKKASQLFEEHNVYINTLAPPFVQPGEEKIRLSLNASHTTQDIYKVLALIEELEMNMAVPSYANAYLP